jgi:hypothetical protein
LTQCPFDALPLAEHALDSRYTYSLFQEVLSVLDFLYENNIGGINISSTNILLEDPSLGSLRFWLTGISSARPVSEDEIEERHSTDVKMALQAFAGLSGGPIYFQDRIANSIFTTFLLQLQGKHLLAKEVLDALRSLNSDEGYFPFRSLNLEKAFFVDLIRFRGQNYYQKSELAEIAWALFARSPGGSKNAHSKIMSTKSTKAEGLPGHEKHLLHSTDAHILFRRLGEELNEFRSDAKIRHKRESDEMESIKQEIRIPIRVTCCLLSDKWWNLSHLKRAVLQADSLQVGNADPYVEVGGNLNYDGIYVKLNKFEEACHLLQVSPPSPSELDSDHRMDLPLIQPGQILLADENLFGTAIFKRSSRTMYYAGKEYPEDHVLQLFPQNAFEDLHRGILQSRHPPQIQEWLGQPSPVVVGSECQSLTESLDNDSTALAFNAHNRNKEPTAKILITRTEAHSDSQNSIQAWISMQHNRRRH